MCDSKYGERIDICVCIYTYICVMYILRFHMFMYNKQITNIYIYSVYTSSVMSSVTCPAIINRKNIKHASHHKGAILGQQWWMWVEITGPYRRYETWNVGGKDRPEFKRAFDVRTGWVSVSTLHQWSISQGIMSSKLNNWGKFFMSLINK